MKRFAFRNQDARGVYVGSQATKVDLVDAARALGADVPAKATVQEVRAILRDRINWLRYNGWLPAETEAAGEVGLVELVVPVSDVRVGDYLVPSGGGPLEAVLAITRGDALGDAGCLVFVHGNRVATRLGLREPGSNEPATTRVRRRP